MAEFKEWFFKRQLPAWGYLLALIVLGGIFLWLIWSVTDVLK
ncbi:MAG: hypothetical protein V3U24_03920 [Candidatus Neomarinimicrobiota bacterium]